LPKGGEALRIKIQEKEYFKEFTLQPIAYRANKPRLPRTTRVVEASVSAACS